LSPPSEGARLLVTLVVVAACLGGSPRAPAQEYFEGFDAPGRPPERAGIIWSYEAQLAPGNWKTLIPGDGYAHLRVERRALRKLSPAPASWPFQTLSLGPVTRDHRISIRAKNTAIAGVAGLLFTYGKKETIDEIDIEIVADDTEGPLTGHRQDAHGGWTDVRLNVWSNAPANASHPTQSLRTPIRDASGQKVSHQDGRFHIYTIEWRAALVRFYIDGVKQAELRSPAPDSPATIIFGLRQMPWAGAPDWDSGRTMLVDWVDIEPLTE
jgi:hypothetical protein